MTMIRPRVRAATGAALAFTLVAAGSASAVVPVTSTGPSSTQSPYLVPVAANVATTSLLTVGDVVGGYKMVGIADGMGSFDNGDGTFTVLMNHELGDTKGVVRAHGAAGSFVSKWTIDKSTLQVTKGEDLIKRIKIGDAASGTFADGTAVALNRLCSADLPATSAFQDAASAAGTATRIFMSGEEAGAEGRALAHVVDGPEAGTSYILPWLGRASWENLVANPNSGARTVVVGLDDSGGGQLYIYVGDKKASGNEAEKAGLVGGKLYGVKIDGVDAETDATTVPAAGAGFSLVEIPGAAAMTGAELETASTALGVTKLARPEDGAWDPTNPNGFYFATTGSFTGISRLWHLDFADTRDVTKGGVATVAAQSPVYDAANVQGPRMMDNLTVADDGTVFVQEDPGGQEYLSGVFKVTKSGAVSRVLRHDAARFVPGAPDFLTKDEESSGIHPVPFLGRDLYLADVQAHYATGDAETVEGGQLLLVDMSADKVASTVEATLDPATVKVRKDAASVAVTVTTADGDPATGLVSALVDGEVVTSVELVDSAATLEIPAQETVGTREVVVRYHGSLDAAGDDSAPMSLEVVKQASRLKAATPTPTKAKKTRGKLVVSATGETVTPTGQVKVRVAGRTRTGTLADGVAVVKLGRFAKRGTYKAVVTYAGDDLHTASRKTVKIKVTR